MQTKIHGPNVKKLITMKMSLDAIPKDGNFYDGLKFLCDSERIAISAKKAIEWVEEAIRVVRLAKEPNNEVNIWKNATDEAIASEILRVIKNKRGKWNN